MEQFIKESIKMGIKMVKELLTFQIRVFMKVNLRIMIFMGMANIYGQMGEFTMEIG